MAEIILAKIRWTKLRFFMKWKNFLMKKLYFFRIKKIAIA
jgi:hypothetical protein